MLCRVTSLQRLLLTAVFLFTIPLFADTIYFRDGSRVDGTIVGQDQKTVAIDTPAGRKIFPKSTVKRLDYAGSMDKDRAAREAAEHQKQQVEQARKEQLQREKLQKEKLQREQLQREIFEREQKANKDRIEKDRVEKEKADKQRADNQKANEQKVKAEKDAALKEQRASNEKPSRFGALKRAAVLPGWGHAYTARTKTGIAIGSGFAALVLATYSETQTANRARLSYEKTARQNIILPFLFTTDVRPLIFGYVINENSTAEEKFNSHKVKRNVLLGLATGLYAVQLGHIAFYTFASQEKKGAFTDSKFNLGVTIKHDF